MLQFLDKGALAASTLLGILDPETGIVSPPQTKSYIRLDDLG